MTTATCNCKPRSNSIATQKPTLALASPTLPHPSTPFHTWKPPGTGMLGPSSVSNSHGNVALTSSVAKKPSKEHCCFSLNSQLSANTDSSSGERCRDCTACAWRNVAVQAGGHQHGRESCSTRPTTLVLINSSFPPLAMPTVTCTHTLDRGPTPSCCPAPAALPPAPCRHASPPALPTDCPCARTSSNLRLRNAPTDGSTAGWSPDSSNASC